MNPLEDWSEEFLNLSIKEIMKNSIIVLLTLAAFSGTAIAESKQNTVANPRAGQLTNKGTVLEVIDSTMYTYLRVSSNTGPIWLAAYKNDIAKGDTINYSGGVEMRNFESKSINRTFDKIIFVDAVAPVK
jgi:hypothetical protein